MKKAAILGFLSLLLLLAGCSLTGNKDVAGLKVLSPEEAGVKAEQFINDNLMPAGQKAAVEEVAEENGLYKLAVNVGGPENIFSYITKDGTTFFPQAIDTIEAGLNSQPDAAQSSIQDVAPISEEDNYVKGAKDAAVEIIEYSDFECPYCLSHTASMDKIFADYKDKIKIAFRHFPLPSHKEAQKAAEASECAGEQGQFWEMHDKIFAANEAGDMSEEEWKKIAGSLGLNSVQFNDCLDGGKYAAKVKGQQTLGQAAGVTGTPATFINGRMLSGSVGYERLKQVIEEELVN